MIRSTLLLVCLGAALPGAAQEAGLDGILGGDLTSKAEPLPVLEDLFVDLGRLLRGADATRIGSLEARLRSTQQELRLLEDLRQTLQRGIVVAVPESMRGQRLPDAGGETVEAEQRSLDDLKADLRRLQIQRERLLKGSAAVMPETVRSSLFAQAALELRLEVPAPPESRAGLAERAATAADPEGLGRALYLAGDHAGSLNAYQAIPETDRSPEVRYRIARCLDQLGRWDEARKAYEAVAATDSEAFWGKLARWMRRFGGHKAGVRGLLERKGS